MKKLILLAALMTPAAYANSLCMADCTWEFNEFKKLSKVDTSGVASLTLGTMYIRGHGTQKNYEKGIKYIQRAAKRRLGSAYYQLGHFYETGNVLEQDKAAAKHWYAKAAEQNIMDAQEKLAMLNGQQISKAKAPKTRPWPKQDPNVEVLEVQPDTTYRDILDVEQQRIIDDSSMSINTLVPLVIFPTG